MHSLLLILNEDNYYGNLIPNKNNKKFRKLPIGIVFARQFLLILLFLTYYRCLTPHLLNL